MTKSHNAKPSRTGGQILVDQLEIQGVKHIFCVPGESYLAALDAMHDSRIEVTVCRQEGGAAMMAEAYGKVSGRPGICFVTRGPGATNASPGVHIAAQDSTPMILFVGQVARGMREREAFQELDYRAVFGSIAKWVVEIDDAARIPELVGRAFHVALNGRPGPVVIALPEDMLVETAVCADAEAVCISDPAPSQDDLENFEALLASSRRPLLIIGGSRWSNSAYEGLQEFAIKHNMPVCVSFRRQSLCSGNYANYVGDLGVGVNPKLVTAVKDSDLVILLGTRLSEIASQSYTVLDIPKPKQKLVHIHPGVDVLGRVYQADLEINVSPGAFLLAARNIRPSDGRGDYVQTLRKNYLDWSGTTTNSPGTFNLSIAMRELSENLPASVRLTTGAGNYAVWVNRFYRFAETGEMLAPTSGSMGYGVPAAIGALRFDREKLTVAFAGDGCFLMNGQEFATAVQYDLPLIVVVVDNGMYGTIRMHQEQHYPGRVIATKLRSPDFMAYALAFGGYGERVERTEDFLPAFNRARAAGKPAILHCVVDPEALTPARSLSEIRDAGLTRA